MARRKRKQAQADLGGTFQALLNSFLAANQNANRILKLGNLGRPGGSQQVAVAEQQLAIARTAVITFVSQNPTFLPLFQIALAGLNQGPL